MRYADARLVDELASAYVLGTLRGGARRRFERLRDARADVALAVRDWEARLGGFASAVQARPAPARVWRAIEARTRPAAAAGAWGAGWWRPGVWGLGGSLAGMALAFWLVLVSPAFFLTAEQVALRTDGRLPQSYVGLLTDDSGNGKLLVSSLRHGRTMTIKAIGAIDEPRPGTRLVVWAVPPDGNAFVLGTAPVKGSVTSELPDTSERLLSKVTRLVASVETGDAPTSPGRIVYRGNCAKLW
jgi:anti-sigma-K factor RskA